MPSSEIATQALATAETDKSKLLTLSLNGKPVENAQFVGKADAQKAPDISWAGAKADSTYLVISLDLDAPFQSLPILGPILHWNQPGLKADASGNLTTGAPFIADYIGPAPPPSSGPHRYAFYLFEEPQGFDVKKYAPADGKPVGTLSRIRYDFDKFIKEAALGPVLAAGHFKSN